MPGTAPTLETFRDPAGSLRIEGDRVLRRIRPEYAAAAVDFLDSPLAGKWVAKGRMVGTEVVERRAGELVLEHPRIFFPTYPWEWTPSQWIAAGELTLDLSLELASQGLILKDATPLNILFEGARPVLVDVLSVEKRDPQSPLWMAYGQFVRSFLLPLAAHKELGWPLATSITRRDGYEPADLYPWVRGVRRWREPLRSLVTVPFLMEGRKKSADRPAPQLRQKPEIATAVLQGNLRGLKKKLRALAPRERDSRWGRYPETAGHYSDADHRQKMRFVESALATLRPSHVLDLGANTGVYSRIAAAQGASVVAWDTDLPASERNFREAREKHLSILAVLADPARPTPAAGWRNAEALSLLDRTRGRFDCVLVLGLIHHLLVADQIPLPQVAALLREVTTKAAIVEWVPQADPRFQDLVRGRDALYAHLTEEAFVGAIEPFFSVGLRERLGNGRTLYLLEVH